MTTECVCKKTQSANPGHLSHRDLFARREEKVNRKKKEKEKSTKKKYGKIFFLHYSIKIIGNFLICFFLLN